MEEINNNDLSIKQRLFVSEYLVDRNGTQAAIRAGYSENSANEQAARLLANASIQSAINSGVVKIEQRNELKTDDIIRELYRIATFDIREMYDKSGEMLPLAEMPDTIAKCIVSFECEDITAGQGDDRRHIGISKKIKLADKTKALELLGKHLKMFVNRIEVDTGDNLAERMKQARERAQLADK